MCLAAGLVGCAGPSLTAEQWQQRVVQAERPVLVDFHSPDCHLCQRLAPVLDRIATDYDGRADVVKVDADLSWTLADRNRVRHIPAVLLFQSGRETKRWVGIVDGRVYRQALDEAIAARPAVQGACCSPPGPQQAGMDSCVGTDPAPGEAPACRISDVKLRATK